MFHGSAVVSEGKCAWRRMILLEHIHRAEPQGQVVYVVFSISFSLRDIHHALHSVEPVPHSSFCTSLDSINANAPKRGQYWIIEAESFRREREELEMPFSFAMHAVPSCIISAPSSAQCVWGTVIIFVWVRRIEKNVICCVQPILIISIFYIIWSMF